MEASTIIILIEQKLQSLNTIASIGMSWWVSSVIFCGSILGGIWLKRHDVAKAAFFNLLGFVLGVFFVSIVIFGFWLVVVVHRIQSEVFDLLKLLGQSSPDVGFWFTGIKGGMLIGTTSFVLITVVWFVLWQSIRQEYKAGLKHVPNEANSADAKSRAAD